MNERHAGNSWMVGLAGVFAVLLALTAPAGAQAPRLVVREDGQPKAMVLDELAVDVAIVGYIAETRLTMTYRNPHSRVLEGELIFPLPEGATVSGYALDVDGHMVDGVVVEKAKAQRVFETVVRRGVDPGLVEWVKGNTFRTRVYPLPAKGKRTVMVRYLSELEIGERAFAYRLPMAFDEKVSAFRLKMSVRQAGAAPAIVAAGPARLMFREGPAERTAEYRASNVRLAEDLVVEIPRADDRRVVVEQAADGWHYFCILDEPGGGAVGAEPAAAPDRVVIFWDASGSRARADRSRELELLRAYFGRFKNRSVAVELVAFRNVQALPQAVSVTNGNTRALEAALAAVAYDGGTQLGCLTVPPAARKPSVILLCSDGNSNFGAEMPGAFAAPVYAVTADPAANHPLLRHVAESSGGEYLHLAALNPAAAAARIGRAPLTLRRATFDPAQVDQLLPGAGGPVAGPVILAGRLLGRQVAVALQYGRGRSETRSVRFRVNRDGAPAGELLRTYWAQRKVRELMPFPERNRAELVDLGRRHGLVTPGTSLLVLERLDQYIEFEVEPPACFPEWREEYAQRVQARRKERADAEQRKIAQLGARRLVAEGVQERAEIRTGRGGGRADRADSILRHLRASRRHAETARVTTPRSARRRHGPRCRNRCRGLPDPGSHRDPRLRGSPTFHNHRRIRRIPLHPAADRRVHAPGGSGGIQTLCDGNFSRRSGDYTYFQCDIDAERNQRRDTGHCFREHC